MFRRALSVQFHLLYVIAAIESLRHDEGATELGISLLISARAESIQSQLINPRRYGKIRSFCFLVQSHHYPDLLWWIQLERRGQEVVDIRRHRLSPGCWGNPTSPPLRRKTQLWTESDVEEKRDECVRMCTNVHSIALHTNLESFLELCPYMLAHSVAIHNLQGVLSLLGNGRSVWN